MNKISDWMELAVEAAQEAGKLLHERFGQKAPYGLKGSHHDLVTEADLLAEQVILERIRQAYPDHGLLSEESPPQRTESPYLWVIDPLDGTTNYAHGIPFFAVSLALEEHSEIILGVIYDPWHQELFSASLGNGAYLNGRPLRVSSARSLRESLLGTGFPYQSPWRERNLEYYRRFLPKAQALRRLGSAALSLAYVASGRLDGYWDLHLHPWDLAAGHLIVKEAGGRVSDLMGKDLELEDQELVASNGHIHEEMLQILGA